MESSTLIFFFLIISTTFTPHVLGGSPSSLQDKCSPAFTKLGECLSYASAKADTPSSACCSSVGDIRATDPVCLCFIIQQAHAGGSTVTSMGLQIDRLTSLPSVCKLANANISDCPRLLKLSPSSPDYAIFTNNGTKASATPATPSGSSSTTSSNVVNSGMVNEISVAAILVATMISALLF